MAAEAVPSAVSQDVVILEVGRRLPAFIIYFFKCTVLAVSVMGQQLDVATIARDGAGVVKTIIADVEFLTLAEVFVV